MLAIYVRSENSGCKILLRRRLLRRRDPVPTRAFAVQARLTRLAVIATLRGTGWVPWLLAAAWIGGASLQEPRLLRGHGIHLVDEAAWVAATALACAVGGSLRPPRVTIPYLFSTCILTSGIAVAVTAVAAATELARGAHAAFPLEMSWLPLVASLAPVVLFVSVAVRDRGAGTRLLAGAGVLWVLASLAGAQTCSVPRVLASIACFSSAAALAFGHCRQNR